MNISFELLTISSFAVKRVQKYAQCSVNGS